MSDADNLGGTTRTLDYTTGYKPLEPGLMSRAGWAVIDDSAALVMNDEGWPEARPTTTDLYFFGYGHDYKACLVDYCKVSGQAPMIPRWALGNWWSRYWAYTQDELTELVEDFERHELPFSVLIVDMDWHVTNTGNQSSGWTGYTWNRELFPDPEGFIRYAHDKQLKISLNLHPAEGIHPHEEQYPAMAERLGIDPKTEAPVVFEIADPVFAAAYFEVLHHPYEKMGVDFWWIDWQQGQKSALAGLDPLWLINHLHFHDLGRDNQRRPSSSRAGARRPPALSDRVFRRYLRDMGLAGVPELHDANGVEYRLRMVEPRHRRAYRRRAGRGTIRAVGAVRGIQPDQPAARDKRHVLRPASVGVRGHRNAAGGRDALQLRHAFVPYLYTMAPALTRKYPADRADVLRMANRTRRMPARSSTCSGRIGAAPS